MAIGVLILILCLIPSSEIRKLDIIEFHFTDLVVHLIMVLVFSATLYRDLVKYPVGSGKFHSSWIIAFSISLFLGISTETLQYLLTSLNRTANLIDLLFDGVGSASGIIAVRLKKRKPDPGS